MKKISFIYIVIYILQFNGFSLNAQQEYQSAILYNKINTYLTNGSNNGFSGAILVIQNDDIIINKGYGFANKDTQTRNNPNTIFDIGSNTKQFTSTAILKLVELGKLKLDDSLGKFFKDVPIKKQKITIHQLLTHTAGFSESIGRDFDKISQEEFFNQLFSSKLLSDPGEKYSYSNTGYSILARIIELVSNQTYEAFLKEYLFTPAGMQQTGYLLPKWNIEQLSRGYNRNVLETDPPVTRYKETKEVYWHLKGNGGINSTQNDMLLWYKALKSNIILTEASLKKLITPHVLAPSGRYSYGYGWGIKNTEDNRFRISHNGSNGTFAHSILWYPKEDIYIVYATNANSSKVEYIAYTIAKIILDENYTPKPIQDNVYSYTMNYIKKHTTDTSSNLITLLKENYADDFNSGVLNRVGNLLLRLNENLNWSLELFKINVQLYPDDGNLWDSLGYGYLANNLKKEAIKSFEKAIVLGYKDAQQKLDELKAD